MPQCNFTKTEKKHLKILDKTPNNFNFTHMTPGEIGTIVLRILWFWYPNFSKICHGVSDLP